MKSLPERIEAVIKVPEEAININSKFFLSMKMYFSHNIGLFQNIFLCVAWEKYTINLDYLV